MMDIASEKLHQAVQLVKAGNKANAQPILIESVRADPENKNAWVWLYFCTEKVGQKRYFLQQALRIDPENQNLQRELLNLKAQRHIIAQPKPPNPPAKPADYEKHPFINPGSISAEATLSGTHQRDRPKLLNGLQIISRFLLRKIVRMVTVLLGVALIMFLLMHAIPGNPWANYSTEQRAMQGMYSSESVTNALNQRFGLNLPLWRQFTRYFIGDFENDGSFFCGALCGNLGPSTRQGGRSVQQILFEPPEEKTFWESRFGYSIRLVLFASLIAVGMGIPLGILSAVKPKSAFSRLISVGLAALISIPNFVLGLLAVIVLASWLKIIKVLPDWDIPSNWITPAVVLAIMPMANIARMTRASLINILHEDYVRTARAKGLTQARIMLVHVMRNALVPIITYLGPTLMEMFTGLLIVENLYSFPGFGREYWGAVLELDYPMILGLTLIYATGIMLVNILIDVLCEILDPRLRSVKSRGAA
jgi:oligopeptide transport system permease protein